MKKIIITESQLKSLIENIVSEESRGDIINIFNDPYAKILVDWLNDQYTFMDFGLGDISKHGSWYGYDRYLVRPLPEGTAGDNTFIVLGAFDFNHIKHLEGFTDPYVGDSPIVEEHNGYYILHSSEWY